MDNEIVKTFHDDFVKAAGGASATSLLVNPGVVFSAGQETLKIGVVGCGGRGSGALGDCLNAAKHLNINTEVVALADFFMDRAVGTARRYGVPEDRCFEGAEAYKKVMASDADVVLLATPPNFRPVL